MIRNALLGLLVFGVTAAVAGFLWVALEFPFAIVVPAAAGWYAVVLADYGKRKASWAALVGGVTFTVAFLVAIFMALSEGSSVALSPWLSAVLAAGAAGAATGWLLGGMKGSIAIAGFSAGGMLVATLAVGAVRPLLSAGVDVAGSAQNAFVAITLGVVGALVGFAAGLGVSWLAASRQ